MKKPLGCDAPLQSMHESVTIDLVRKLVAGGTHKIGACIGCGMVQDGIARDAYGWPCGHCGSYGAMGIDELLPMVEKRNGIK